MPLIETEFDGLLEEDIVFEETDQLPSYEELLKNAENMLKSFLYMKKIFNSSDPFINTVIKASTIDTSAGKERYFLDEDTGMILIKNIDGTHDFSIFINDGEFVLFPFESIEFPVSQGMKIETFGKFSIMESKFGL